MNFTKLGEVANDIVDTRVCVPGVLIEVAGRGDSGDMLYYRAQSGYKERTNFMRRRENLSPDRKSTRLNSSHITRSRMPSSA